MPKSDKKIENYHENGSLGMDALAKHVEKDDSPKWGLIDSKGRRQKTIIINESDHVDDDDEGRNVSFTPLPIKRGG